jgi:hypothetical protein
MELYMELNFSCKLSTTLLLLLLTSLTLHVPDQAAYIMIPNFCITMFRGPLPSTNKNNVASFSNENMQSGILIKTYQC